MVAGAVAVEGLAVAALTVEIQSEDAAVVFFREIVSLVDGHADVSMATAEVVGGACA